MLIALLAMFFLQRLLFLLFNYSSFSQSSSIEIFKALLWGVRFDLWVVLAFNILIFLIVLFSWGYRLKKMVAIYFVGINALLFLFNIIDIEYFKFTLKRSTADLFNLISTGSDVWILLPQFLIDFWYIVLIWLLFVWMLWFCSKKWIMFLNDKESAILTGKKGVVFIVFLLFFLVINMVVLRGTRLRPVNLLSASLYANSNLVPLVLNTPFSIVKTWGKPIHQVHNYFDDEKQLMFSPVYTTHPSKTNKLPLKNVVVLILESFSKEHIGFFNKGQKPSFTPFLDSLLSKSLVVRYSFANGLKSIESLPSILASIPSLMETPYILSPFSSNEIEALPNILKRYGYSTSFFHGGTNGTMGFDVFSAMAGIERYYGRWQYPNSDDYDGNWGIWDEPYLQYVSSMLDKEQQPFFTVIYTLSSHHPYKVPDKYKNILPKGEHEILQSIAYTDLSLKRFFEQAKKSKWFQNTLFVITADHVFGSHSEFYYRKIGVYSVPIAFYTENDTNLRGVLPIIAQHCDIAPSILDYLGIQTSMISFGSSIWDISKKKFAINYINGNYLFVMDNVALEFDGEDITGVYQFKTDSMLMYNLIQQQLNVDTTLKFLKSIIQQYDQALVKNRLTVKKFY